MKYFLTLLMMTFPANNAFAMYLIPAICTANGIAMKLITENIGNVITHKATVNGADIFVQQIGDLYHFSRMSFAAVVDGASFSETYIEVTRKSSSPVQIPNTNGVIITCSY